MVPPIALPLLSAVSPQLQHVLEKVNGDSDKRNNFHSEDTEIDNLLGILHHAASTSDKGIVFSRPIHSIDAQLDAFAEQRLSYKELSDIAWRCAMAFKRLSAVSREYRNVLIHLDNQRDNIEMFWSVVTAGGVPVVSTPLSADYDQRFEHLKNLKLLLNDPVCISSQSLVGQFPELKQFDIYTVEAIRQEAGLTAHSVHNHSAEFSYTPPNGSLIRAAALMLTSGSTGNAKAVVLTAPQMVASIRGKIDSLGSNKQWTLLNWIGLDHVANLTEIHLHAMLNGADQVQVQASDVLPDPLFFIRLIDRHRVRYSFAPNFFLTLLEKELASARPDDSIKSVDLSCLNSIVSGGEANVVQTANELTKQLNSLKASGQLIRVGYGLTEACAALTYGLLDPAYEFEEQHEFASIGRPIRGAKIRVVASDGKLADVYELGSLELAGPNVFKEYYNDPGATKSSFTLDGWFKTGDTGYLDKTGRFNLAGRAKELLNINGVKYSPKDIESVLEKSNLKGALASCFAVFSHRASGSNTEGYCIVYGTHDEGLDIATVEQIASLASILVSVRPHWVIPLSQSRMDKSSLGKLSRTRLQKFFGKGMYDNVKIQTDYPLRLSGAARIAPEGNAEVKVVETVCEMLNIPPAEVSTDQTIFDLGVTSISMFRFEKLLRRKFGSDVQQGISIISFLSNPVLRAIAASIEKGHTKDGYNPCAVIQSKGTKTPLWLVHAATGNTLAFLPLARKIVDRPLYALTSRGLGGDESHFTSIAEMADTYHKHIKRVQPQGPYAISGYSLGSTVAFEIAKRLVADNDEVAFCAALDSPPDISPLIIDLDWTDAAVLVTYFLELIPQDLVPILTKRCRGRSKQETVVACLEAASADKQNALNLGPEQLLAIADVTNNFGNMAKKYVPEGKVPLMDVFFCTPLQSVGMDRNGWVQAHLSRWQDHSQQRIKLHECEGDHADMLNPKNIDGFEKRLAQVLEARGI